MSARDPRAIPFLMIAAGLGLALYFGEQWRELPNWNEVEIRQSAELNLALDLQRMGPLLQPAGARLQELRARERAEVEGEIRRDREKVQRWVGAGLLLMVFGTGQYLLTLARRAP